MSDVKHVEAVGYDVAALLPAMVDFVCANPAGNQLSSVLSSKPDGTVKRSISEKDKGNEHFKKKNWIEAIIQFTTAAREAEAALNAAGSPARHQLAVNLANRSAATVALISSVPSASGDAKTRVMMAASALSDAGTAVALRPLWAKAGIRLYRSLCAAQKCLEAESHTLDLVEGLKKARAGLISSSSGLRSKLAMLPATSTAPALDSLGAPTEGPWYQGLSSNSDAPHLPPSGASASRTSWLASTQTLTTAAASQAAALAFVEAVEAKTRADAGKSSDPAAASKFAGYCAKLQQDALRDLWLAKPAATAALGPPKALGDAPGLAVAQPYGGRALALSLAASPGLPTRLCAIAQLWNESRGRAADGAGSADEGVDCSRRAGVAAVLLRCSLAERVAPLLRRSESESKESTSTGTSTDGELELEGRIAANLAAALRHGPHGQGLPVIGAPEDLAMGVARGLGFGASASRTEGESAWEMPAAFRAGSRGATDLPLHNYAAVEKAVPKGWLLAWQALGQEAGPGVAPLCDEWAVQAKALAAARAAAGSSSSSSGSNGASASAGAASAGDSAVVGGSEAPAPQIDVLEHLHATAARLGPEQRAACEWLWVYLSATERRLVLLDLWQFYCRPLPAPEPRAAAAADGAEAGGPSSGAGVGGGDLDDVDAVGLDAAGGVPESVTNAMSELD